MSVSTEVLIKRMCGLYQHQFDNFQYIFVFLDLQIGQSVAILAQGSRRKGWMRVTPSSVHDRCVTQTTVVPSGTPPDCWSGGPAGPADPEKNALDERGAEGPEKKAFDESSDIALRFEPSRGRNGGSGKATAGGSSQDVGDGQ